MSEASNVPAVRDESPNEPVRVFGGGMGIYTSLDKSNRANAQLIMKCLNDCTHRLADVLGKTIDLVHVFAHRVEMADDDTGEVREQVRCVLIDANNATYECVSGGIGRDIANIIDLFGKPPYAPPIRVEVFQKSLAGGRRMFKLRMTDVQPDAAPSVKPAKR